MTHVRATLFEKGKQFTVLAEWLQGNTGGSRVE
jgi:hypothetical protein